METMNEKIQRVLDGDLPSTALSAHETEIFSNAVDVIGRVITSIPSPGNVDLAPGVMARIRSGRTSVARSPIWKRAITWVWSPRPLSIHWRPAYAFGLAALLFIGVGLVRRAPAAAPPQQVLVQFRLDAPQAHQVSLAGNFTSWKADVALKRGPTGVWTVVVPLAAGVHNYAFVVDGNRWIPDPMAQAVSDGFGGTNSQLAVLTPDDTKAL